MDQLLYDFLAAFLDKPYQQRWLDQVSRAKPNDNLLRGMDALSQQLDKRYCLKLPKGSKQADIAFVRQALVRYKLTHCYVLSAYAPFHQQMMPLDAALECIIGDGPTSIISFLAGKAAYFEGHSPGERYLCIREA